jgi:hypothetical protein
LTSRSVAASTTTSSSCRSTKYPRTSGAGWPDLVCVRPPRLIFAELKSETGALRPRQCEWLDVLRLLPQVEVFVWPADWDELVETLTGTAPRTKAA